MRHRQLGSVFHETLGPVSAVFISDPTDMRRAFASEGKYPIHLLPDAWVLYNKLYDKERGLFFMHGPEWLKYRHIMNKLLFKNERTKGQLRSYKVATSDFVKEWSRIGASPVENAVGDLYNLSISYVIATLLGSSYPEHRDKLKSEVNQLSTIVYSIFEESAKLNLLPAKIAATFKLPVWQRFVSSVSTTLTSAEKLVNQSFPLAAEDGILLQMEKEGITRDKIVSIVVDLILAAADTTPYTLLWALYLLGRNPEVQNEVAQDILKGTNDPEQWLNNPFIRAVMQETLRLYPVAPFLTRELAVDCEMSGYNIPAGTMVIMSLYTSGHSEAHFPSPEKFWPSRWLRSGEDGRLRGVNDKSASLPFAIGGRACIGRRVAMAQIGLTLSEILSQFHVEVKKEVDMVLMLVTVPSENIPLFLTQRKL
ncbi:cytochrome P450 315a1, mitochondrial isoform X2 [Macrosteles quadrilineatus]|nr:cytochrome P450 315a1, mitochondrial isoform X2 [Macrosteles quadrilineatus]